MSTTINFLDDLGDGSRHSRRYGVYVDGQLVARIWCVSEEPPRWVAREVGTEIDVLPRQVMEQLWSIPEHQTQKRELRELVIDHYNEVAEASYAH